MSMVTPHAIRVAVWLSRNSSQPTRSGLLSTTATRYKGGGLAKSQLVAANAIGAAIDDGILDIAFRVQSFETVFFDNMGNAVPMASDGAAFSARQKETFRKLARNRARQKETFRKLARNRRFYVSRVTVVGPDGLTRTLQNPMEVIVK